MTIKKVDINLVRPNPHRDLINNPLDQGIVSDLVASYRRNGFFGALPARKLADPVGEYYEIAAGHHRLEALKMLGATEVMLDIQAYDDDRMISVMGAENMIRIQVEHQDSAVARETVRSAMMYLGRLVATEDWKRAQKITCGDGNPLFPNKRSFSNCVIQAKNVRGGAVGRGTIMRYLTGTMRTWQARSTFEAITEDPEEIAEINDTIAEELEQLRVDREAIATALAKKTIEGDEEADRKAIPKSSRRSAQERTDAAVRLFEKQMNLLGVSLQKFVELLQVTEHVNMPKGIANTVFTIGELSGALQHELKKRGEVAHTDDEQQEEPKPKLRIISNV